MQNITFDCSIIAKAEKIIMDKKKDKDIHEIKLVKECNDVVLEFDHDAQLHNKCKILLQHTVNKMLLHNNKMSFSS